MKVIDGLRWGAARLIEKGNNNARFDADMLLAWVLNITRPQLYLEGERDLSQTEEAEYRGGVLRRAKYEPLQYILKRQEFMGLSFYVDERVLIPRADSEILVEKWLEVVRLEDNKRQESKLEVADLCTGSGALAISMAHYYPKAEVVGTDLSSDALEVARLNAQSLGVTVQWRQGDFLAPILGELWDYIITNPPYVSKGEYEQCDPEIFREPSIALLGGQDGLDFYRRLADGVGSILKPQGKLLMEIGCDQAEAVCGLFQFRGFETQVFPDLAGRDRVILAR